MARLSAVLPCFSVNEELRDLALECATRIRDQVDELIITEDADVYWRELHEISNVYLIHPQLRYKANFNLGNKVATGDYVLQVNSDALFLEGNLRDLCVDGIGIARCIDTGNEAHLSQAMGAFYVIPKYLFDIHGGWLDTHDPVWNFGLFDTWNRYVSTTTIPTVTFTHPRAGGTSYRHEGLYKER